MTDGAAGRGMRGVEAALYVWNRAEHGALIAEELRALGGRLSPADLTLATALCYAMCRRLSLWRRLRETFMRPSPRKFSRAAQTAVLCGVCGLAELKNFAPAVLISSLIDWTKSRDPRGARVVNAVLRRAFCETAAELERLERDPSLEARCLLLGVPLWAARLWRDCYGASEAERIASMCAGSPSLSLRLSPSAPPELPRLLARAGRAVSASPLPEGLRVEGTALPTALPGWKEGWFAAQSESSIVAGREAADFEGAYLLDMCAGRGVKTGQIALARPDIRVEAWDLSEGRLSACAREMERLGVGSRVRRKTGDALVLTPDRAPDAVLLDAPCSGSGTWRRHPEGKWRLDAASLGELAAVQERLLERAFALVKPGGKVVYSTCSLFASENERVVARVLPRCPGAREVPPARARGERREAGTALLPDTPWTDGFYLAVFVKD